MNFLKMKLALTVDLMNSPFDEAAIDHARDAMGQFAEAGKFTGYSITTPEEIVEGIEKQHFALEYENVTLGLDLITNARSRQQFVQGFELTAR